MNEPTSAQRIVLLKARPPLSNPTEEKIAKISNIQQKRTISNCFQTEGSDKRLLIKIEGHGVNGKVLSWVKALLTDRRQKVLLVRPNQSQSDWSTVTIRI